MGTSLVDRAAGVLARRTSRRRFLLRAAVIGSAVVTKPSFLIRPVSAYAAVCGPDNTFASGYTVFCCSVYRGMNKCPPGTFVGGWWKADNSSYCCNNGRPGPRYYTDCHAYCRCSSGCASGFCDSSCVACNCHAGTNGCDRRRVCCNQFRYGQCNQHIGCAGAIACRTVTCTPPYRLYDSCGTTLLYDNRTANHTAPCLSGRCN